MQSKKLAKPKPGPATQNYLDISEIREDVVVMKDGTLRSVILVSSINFALKSEEEQMAIIQAYMGFLNGLEFPLQVVIQSRKMNIDPYIASLEKQQRETVNEALRAQIADYLSFVTELITLGEVMQKQFFVVIPYDPARNKAKGFFARLTAAIQPLVRVKIKQKEFEDRKTELMRRTDIITSQLASMGLVGSVLDTQGLIELYYTVYNPDIFDTERMQDISKLQVEE